MQGACLNTVVLMVVQSKIEKAAAHAMLAAAVCECAYCAAGV